MKKNGVTIIIVFLLLVILGSVGFYFFNNPSHEHTFESSWSYDSQTHWKQSTCIHNVKGEESSHTFNSENKCICGYENIDLELNAEDLSGYIHYSTYNSIITFTKNEVETQIWYQDSLMYEKTGEYVCIRELLEDYVNVYQLFSSNGEWTKTTENKQYGLWAGEYVKSKYEPLKDIELIVVDNLSSYNYDKNANTLKTENLNVDLYTNLTNVLYFNKNFKILMVEYEFIYNGDNYFVTLNFDDFEVEVPTVESVNLSVSILPDGTYVLDSIGDCNDKDLIIPSKIGDIEITSIAPNAFANTDIRSVVIPGTVKTIGEGAFENCNSLSYVYIDEGVEKIEKDAFSMIDPVAEVHFYDTVTEIEENAFDINVGVFNRGKWFFYGDVNKYVQIDFGNDRSNPNLNCEMYLNGEPLVDVVIDTATYISSYSFASLDSPKNYYIGKQVKKIGYLATGGFYTDIDHETGVMEFIPYNVYYEGNLEDFLKIEFEGKWVADIGCNLYFEGNLVETVELPQGISIIPEGLFGSCISIKNVIIPEGVTKIKEYAFYGCPIVNLTLPVSLLEVEYNAFDTYGLFISPNENAITFYNDCYYMAANGNKYYLLLSGTEIHSDCVIAMNQPENT